MAQKNALGRGLGALIEDADQAARAPGAAMNEIDIDKIEVNPFQPRKSFDEESLRELASSIREIGIIQPITVRKLNGDTYQLITGERRFKAASLAGLADHSGLCPDCRGPEYARNGTGGKHPAGRS